MLCIRRCPNCRAKLIKGGVERGKRNVTFKVLCLSCDGLACDVATITQDLPHLVQAVPVQLANGPTRDRANARAVKHVCILSFSSNYLAQSAGVNRNRLQLNSSRITTRA